MVFGMCCGGLFLCVLEMLLGPAPARLFLGVLEVLLLQLLELQQAHTRRVVIHELLAFGLPRVQLRTARHLAPALAAQSKTCAKSK